MVYSDKNFKLADLFFYIHEEQEMKVFILRNFPLKGNTHKKALENGVKLVEELFDTCEWGIDFNKNMPILINNKSYHSLPAGFDSFRPSQIEQEATGRYKFCLLITGGNHEVEIITDFLVTAESYTAAIAQSREWIEMKYSHFEELEWYINNRMQICVI